MAILRGFPPSSTISPSVRIAEKDLSFIAPAVTFARAGIVGFASKGPINVATVITTNRQLNTIFGNPHPETGDPYLIYAANQYLLAANELYVVRVAETSAVNDEAATTASIQIPAAGGIIKVISNLAGDYSFPTDSFFRWKLNGVLASKTLVVLADANRPSPDTGDPYTTTDLVAALNEQLDFTIDGIEFVVGTGDVIEVDTTFAYGPGSSLELVSVQDAIYGGSGSITGLGTGMTEAASTGANDRYPNNSYQVAGTYDFSGVTGLELDVVIDGTDNVLIDNTVQAIDLSALDGTSSTITDVVNEINNQITLGNVPGGFVASATGDNLTLTTLHAGRDAKLLVKTLAGSAYFGFTGLTASGVSPSGVTTDVAVDTYGIITGNSVSSVNTFELNADSPGIEGNLTQVVIKNDARENSFTMEVYSGGNQVESWGGLTKDASSRFYVESYISTVSDFIKVVDDTSVGAPPLDGTYDLSGGSDGIPADPDDQDSLIIGSPTAGTGLYALSEPEQIDIDLIACPGHASTSVIVAMIDVAQNYRQDCLALVDPPFGLTVNEIINWQNGTHPLNSDRFDTDFAALYWPWLMIRDTYNGVDVWVPPSGSMLAVIARSDSLSAPWYAPAGETRGQVPNIGNVFTRPTLEERDLMYGNRNCINPIIQFANSGFVVWGQKTLQRAPTALDRINVRRMMFYIEKRIRTVSRSIIFDPNDETLRSTFTTLATAILREVQVGRGLSDYFIDVSDEVNTPDTIDRNEFHARIGVQPTRAAEFIFIEFSIHRTGSFTENANNF